MRATSDVEKSISIMATLSSSLVKYFWKGSVWYRRKPLEVPRRNGVSAQVYSVS